MSATSANFGSSKVITNEKDEPDHLLVLVHGILASPSDWTYFEAELKKRLGRNFLIYASSCNSYTKTFSGIDGAGKRLAEEVRQVVQKTESLKKISFVAHSLGGLFARYAVSVLYTMSGLCNGELGDASRTSSLTEHDFIAGLEPVNFITLASPHLGVRGRRQLPLLLGVPFLEKLAPPIASFLVGCTGSQLFLTDGKPNRPPLLLRMATDCDDGKFISALGAFKCRILYANVSFDYLVGWRTSSIRREKELPKHYKTKILGGVMASSSSDAPSASDHLTTGDGIMSSKLNDYIMGATEEEGEQHQTPNKCKSPTHVVKEWIPICEEELKPREGLEFANLEECEKFYKSYAHFVGFSIRKSRSKKNKEGVPKYKYYVCSKQGFRQSSTNVKCSRKVKLTREGCNAMVGFRRTSNETYVLFKFHEGHTHELATPRKRHMLNSNRGVTSVHRTLFKSLACANIGPSKAHRIIKEQVGGFQNVGCSKQDLKNFQRDLKAFIKDSDAQMFIENFKRKQKIHPSFYFAYELDVDGTLKHVFWADGIARFNYSLYGDVLSFDTTYDTNRYKMIFAPFTGLDKHRLCVSFGAAFLSDEKSESFMWLFDKFLDAMGGHMPVCLITDQDPAMKVAINAKFPSTTHRFCIWHIMRKLSEKVGSCLNGDDAFLSRFKSCVYNSETPFEFEQEWQSIVTEFGLQNNAWLSQLYDIREMWIPAYFRDVFLGAVLRTTSRSESENNFFSNFTNPHLSLVEFWMRYESALELQRYGQLQLDNETSSSVPLLKTTKDLERHASEVYTFTNFYKFQDEFWNACMDCEIEDRQPIDEGFIITVIHNTRNTSQKREVTYNPSNHMAHCSCKMFECEGIPCCHILCVLKGKALRELPSYYIVNRWTKMAASNPIFDVDSTLSEGCSQIEQEDKLISRNWLDFLGCMQMAARDPEKLTIVSKGIHSVMKEMKALNGSASESKMSELESFIGSSVPEQIDILPPKQCNTKGSGKRIKGGKEKAMEHQSKRLRLCKACGQQAYHDSRNCPTKLS